MNEGTLLFLAAGALAYFAFLAPKDNAITKQITAAMSSGVKAASDAVTNKGIAESGLANKIDTTAPGPAIAVDYAVLQSGSGEQSILVRDDVSVITPENFASIAPESAAALAADPSLADYYRQAYANNLAGGPYIPVPTLWIGALGLDRGVSAAVPEDVYYEEPVDDSVIYYEDYTEGVS
jgi:hypothetical protein